MNCAQTFGKEIAGIPSESVSVMQTYYSAGTMAALVITSLVMIASTLCNYTILSAAAKMSATAVILMNVVITVIGVVLALFVNLRYGKLLARTEK